MSTVTLETWLDHMRDTVHYAQRHVALVAAHLPPDRRRNLKECASSVDIDCLAIAEEWTILVLLAAPCPQYVGLVFAMELNPIYGELLVKAVREALEDVP